MSIKTTKANHAVIKRLQDFYKFQQMHLPAKIAIAYSLQQNKKFDIEEYNNLDNGGVEFSEDILFSGRENYAVYKAIFSQHYGRILGESEFSRLTKIHLDWGLDKLRENVLDTDRGRNAHIDFLLSLIKRGTNLIANEQNIIPSNNITNVLKPPFTVPDLVAFELGETLDTKESIVIKLNDLKEYESHHIAIAGTTGSGKTELIKDILTQIHKNTSGKLKYIFFDYKGEGESNKLKPFLDITECEYINPLEQDFNFNPLSFINISNERYLNFHINSFVDAVAAIETKLGAKQKNTLKTVLASCFEKKKKQGVHPTLIDLFDELRLYYDENDEKVDSLYAIIEDLSSGIFAQNITNNRKIYEQNMYISLPEAMSEKLRQLCVFLTLKYLLSEFTAMDDTIPNSDRINPLRYVIVIDEAHVYLNNKNARSILEQLLRVIRSKGVVVIMLSQGPEDYQKPDFDFSSQVKIPICLHIKNKNEKTIEKFVGTVKGSSLKLKAPIDKLDKGLGLINLTEPKTIQIRQFWRDSITDISKI